MVDTLYHSERQESLSSVHLFRLGLSSLVHSFSLSAAQYLACRPCFLPLSWSRVPCNTILARSLWRVMWPNHASFPLVPNIFCCWPTRACINPKTNMFVLWPIHDTIKMCLQHLFSNACIFLAVSTGRTQLSVEIHLCTEPDVFAAPYFVQLSSCGCCDSESCLGEIISQTVNIRVKGFFLVVWLRLIALKRVYYFCYTVFTTVNPTILVVERFFLESFK